MSKFIFPFLFLSFLNFGQNNEIDPKYKKMIERIYDDFETIEPSEAEKLIDKDKVFFLDTREKVEFEVSHIKNAIFVGYEQFDWSKLKNIPKSATIVIYCSVGARSQTMGKKLMEKGYTNVKNLYGGLFLWANQEREMVDSNNKKTTKIHAYNKIWGKWIKKGEKVY